MRFRPPVGRMDAPEPFAYDGGEVAPGETATIRHDVGETYLGEPVRVPVTVVVGGRPGPRLCLTAAVHGDELNGVEVVRTVAHDWAHDDLAGTLVCLPVLNVPGFLARERYLPVQDRDLNRAFPGSPDGTAAERMANEVWRQFVDPCDACLDFHTSTRGRTNMLHVRADLADPGVERLAKAFGTSVVIDSEGPSGSLRRAATAAGVPTVAVEMGAAHRFERPLIDRALAGVRSVCGEYDLLPGQPVRWPGWRTVVEDGAGTAWLRADAGGLVETHRERGALLRSGEPICTIADPFADETTTVRAPFTGLLVGVLENPVVSPGNPLCHVVELDDSVRRVVERERSAGES